MVKRIILFGTLIGLVAVLDFVGVISFPIGIFGVSGFYIGSAFYTAFAVWFRKTGLISIYFGLLLGAVLAGTFTVFALGLALGNVLGASLPFFLVRAGLFDPSIKTKKDLLVFLVSVTIGQNVIGAAWTLTGFYLVGFMPVEAILPSSLGWIIGGMAVSLIITLPMLKGLTPLVNKLGLTNSTEASAEKTVNIA
jgi:hypothetical protein